MSPRPILKRSSTTSSTPSRSPHSGHDRLNRSHAVHFPPSPTLTRTFSAHSPSFYDRSPIVVAPNSCALPERGCPGRTYTLDDDETAASTPVSPTPSRLPHRHLHPRAVNYSPWPALSFHNSVRDRADDDEDNEDQRTPTRTFPLLPPLVPDLSSESDESDGFTSPPPEYVTPSSSPPFRIRAHDEYSAYDITTPTALSYLPHPHSSSLQHTAHDREDNSSKTRRRTRRRSHERGARDSAEEDRVGKREAKGAFDAGDGSYKSFSMCKALSNCKIDEGDGCLGGF